MGSLLVTVGTDGVTDWVKLPTGQRLSLGPVSVLSFVTKLAQGGRMAKRTLDEYLRNREAMLSVDEERMWAVLAPRRRRWATDDDGSFIAPDQRTTISSGDETMETINQHLTDIETHLQAMDRAAAAGASPEKMKEGWGILCKLAGKIKSPSSPQDATYFGLGHTVAAAQDPAEVGGHVEGLTFDMYAANNELANEIIAKAEETKEAIDRAAAKHGPKFAASKARQDLHAVTSKVAGILNSTSLTEPWVIEDLQKLATRNDQLHSLFFPKK